MPRLPRHKNPDATFYHLLNRVAGDPADFPLRKGSAARRFLYLFEFYLRLYCCRLAAFQLMGNHYHSVVYFEQFRVFERAELEARARLRFGCRWRVRTRHWSPSDWEQFNRDLFDVSRFMQHVNGEFSKWYNRRYGRRGHFWADRFKNPELLDPEAVQLAILYCELNAVRAGRVPRPEADRRGSAYWRWRGRKSDLLMPLEELFPVPPGENAFSLYRRLLYDYGAVAGRQHPGVIPHSTRRQQQQHGFVRAGLLRRRLRFLSDGVAIGSRQKVRALLEHYRREGFYRRRQNPISQLQGRLFSLREQRAHAFSPG
jgi:hypothetical protein